MRHKCEHTKTFSGYCENQVVKDEPYCHYHKKVEAELMDAPDVADTVKQLPTIKEK